MGVIYHYSGKSFQSSILATHKTFCQSMSLNCTLLKFVFCLPVHFEFRISITLVLYHLNLNRLNPSFAQLGSTDCRELVTLLALSPVSFSIQATRSDGPIVPQGIRLLIESVCRSMTRRVLSSFVIGKIIVDAGIDNG